MTSKDGPSSFLTSPNLIQGLAASSRVPVSLCKALALATIAVLSLIQRPVNTKELEFVLLPKGSLQLAKYRLSNCTDLVLNPSAAALSQPRNLTKPQLSHLQNVMVMPISWAVVWRKCMEGTGM